MVLVHVIPPAGTDGDRHEERFPAGTTGEQVLAALTRPRRVPGGYLPPLQEGYGRLRPRGDTGPGVPYLDHPGTVVAVGRAEAGVFVETERLQGPPA